MLNVRCDRNECVNCEDCVCKLEEVCISSVRISAGVYISVCDSFEKEK